MSVLVSRPDLAGLDANIESYSPLPLVASEPTETQPDDSSTPDKPGHPRTVSQPLRADAVVFVEVPIYQTTSELRSVERFVASRYQEIHKVVALYRQRVGEELCFFVVTQDDVDETLDAVFDLEQFFYRRLEGQVLDFQVLPGVELESCVPSGALRCWQR